LQMLRGQCKTQTGMVCTPCCDPRGRRYFQVRLRSPYRPANGKFGQRLFWSDYFECVYEQAETVSEVDERYIHRGSTLRREHESNWVGFAADRERMNF